jgi:hypothetical protein
LIQVNDRLAQLELDVEQILDMVVGDNNDENLD